MGIFSRIYNTPTVLQMECAECGAASLGMILGYYGRYESLSLLREECGVTRDGSKASLIVKAAKTFGLEAKGFKMSIADLVNLNGPAIIFWNFEHFLVLEGGDGNKSFYLNDPADGKKVLSLSEFEKGFTGVVLVFTPSSSFVKNKKTTVLKKSLKGIWRDSSSLFITALFCGFLLSIPTVIFPSVINVFIDYIMNSNRDWLPSILILMSVMVGIEVVLSSILYLVLRRGTISTSLNRTYSMFKHMLSLPVLFFSTRSNAELQVRLSLNEFAAKTVFSKITADLVSIIAVFLLLVLMLLISYKMTMVIGGILAIDLLFLYYIIRKRAVLNQSIISLKTKLMNSMLVNIDNLESIKAMGKENVVFSEWADMSAEYNRKELSFNVSSVYYNSVPIFLGVIANVLMFCFGSYLVINSEIYLGEMFSFVVLSCFFITPITSLIMNYSELNRLRISLEKIDDIIEYKQTPYFKPVDQNIATAVNSTTIITPDLEATVSDNDIEDNNFSFFEMRDICFAYTKYANNVITDFNLKISPGERVAIVGVSGSGKSTVAKIASGLLRPTSGDIFLNGRSIRDYTEQEYYQIVSMVDQQIVLFSGTVRENLSFFDPSANNFILQKALKDASLEQELIKRGSLLNLEIAEDGMNFSGGQRQRLEIARVFARHKSLLILDEATSALDPLTEKEIDNALRRQGCAAIIIAHRLSTIRDADKIIIMDHGHIVEQGTYQKLIKNNGYFKQMMVLEDGEQYE